MQNARLDESQARINIARRNINNLRYADDTTLMAESEEELKSILMKVKSESEVTQSCPTLHDPMDCSPPGTSIHGICQARVLEWGAIAEYIIQNVRQNESQAGIKIAGRNTNNLRYADDTTLMAESEEELKKKIYFCFIDYIKAFNCIDYNKPGNS